MTYRKNTYYIQEAHNLSSVTQPISMLFWRKYRPYVTSDGKNCGCVQTIYCQPHPDRLITYTGRTAKHVSFSSPEESIHLSFLLAI